MAQLEALTSKLNSNLPEDIIELYTRIPRQEIVWKSLSFLKKSTGSSTIYNQLNCSRFKSSLTIPKKHWRNFFIEPEVVYKSIARAFSLLSSASTRNLQIQICSHKILSPVILNRIEATQNPGSCNVCMQNSADQFHTYYSCELSQYVHKISQKIMYLSNFPKIDLSPASFYLVSPPEKNMNKTQYKAITAFLANNHVFRRLIDWNRTITHNETLFLKIFQNFHQVCAKITRRFGNPLYPIFRGDLSSFKIKFPKLTLSPLIADPPFLSYHRAQSQISISKVDNLVESLFPVTKDPLPDHNSWPASKKALRAVTLAHPGCRTSFD